MQWTDEGIVLGGRRHGETSLVLEALTRSHGRHLGLARGGRSKALAAVLQPGNLVRLDWRARLEDNLGVFTAEGLRLNAARFLERRQALYGVSHLAALLRLLPERDPHPALYDAAAAVLDRLDDADLAPSLLVRLEAMLLGELGFGLDLSACAATGRNDDLAYVSPRSGRAVGREAGRPYHDRLLPLPRFLIDGAPEQAPARAEVLDAFRLTGHFLERDVLAPRGLALPPARAALLDGLSAARGPASAG